MMTPRKRTPEQRIPRRNWEEVKAFLDKQKEEGEPQPSRTWKINLTLHNVGQGLFCSGRLNSFAFVYDCGVGDNSPRAYLNGALTAFFDELKEHKIDLLVLSHFHADHVSGLEVLMNGAKVGYVVLPYLTPSERAAVAAANPGEEDWYYNFVVDPAKFFFDKDENVKVVFVTGSRDDTELPDVGKQGPGGKGPRETPNEPTIDEGSFVMPDDDSAKRKIFDLDSQLEPIKDRLLVKNHRGWLVIQKSWVFRFFNHRLDEKKLDDFETGLRINFGLAPREPITMQKMHDAIKSKAGRRKLRTSYKQIGGDFNNTSLMAFHGPLGAPRIESRRFSWGGTLITNLGKLVRLNPNLPPSADSFPEYFGFMLTGDANCNLLWDEFDTHFRSYFDHVSVAFLPHHGSEKSWNPSLKNRVRGGALWYVSAGLHNTYGHPSLSVVDELVSANFVVIWANELSSISEDYELSW